MTMISSHKETARTAFTTVGTFMLYFVICFGWSVLMDYPGGMTISMKAVAALMGVGAFYAVLAVLLILISASQAWGYQSHKSEVSFRSGAWMGGVAAIAFAISIPLAYWTGVF